MTYRDNDLLCAFMEHRQIDASEALRVIFEFARVQLGPNLPVRKTTDVAPT